MSQHPHVHAFHHAASGTWSYVVEDGQDAAVIDPVVGYDPQTGALDDAPAQALAACLDARGLHLRWILETHAHADHVSAAQWFKQRWPQATLAIGDGIREVRARFAPQFGLDADAQARCGFDHLFADGERFAIGSVQAQVIAVPGHTGDSVAYLIGDALFPGDSLFMPDSGTARCDFPGGDAATLYRSIQRLYALPEATRVFVCHDYGAGGRAVACQTSIGEQRRSNIHVRDGIDEAAFVALRQARDATLAEPRLMQPSVRANIQAGRTDDLAPPAA
ncbi:MBL fold metallo-hydrolase [Xanthomonas sp. A2111]|uniref:MBL fold metallo-hydrolase n=1 Tax=Xanthomonas hawaiiensis TaxID=3003247 RepID=A0ABU2I1U1_9XANT|nr:MULTISPECIES: MBL fold metallo-hydrolase [unclassified Xanthomonas]MBO9828696.1 MBL fold metallo-hydrolase [Xanthomonas sp. A2111]MBO9873875.1 MBL fold metallo-hydrolase [Xanthomonas sp. D-93]MDS9992111.1 MBL fold metallo-hydrolase [Xanthomonas sp. A2111]WNH43909.1 MBL fold metallo-hydrolase [Xanthomonas sp. A6251]